MNIQRVQDSNTTSLVQRYAVDYRRETRNEEGYAEVDALLQRKIMLEKQNQNSSKEYQAIVERLLCHVLYLVHREAKALYYKANPNHLHLDDLFHEGCIGAVVGIRKHNGTGRITTYVQYWIYAYLLQALRRSEYPIYIPKHIILIQQRIKTLLREDRQEHYRVSKVEDTDAWYERYCARFPKSVDTRTSFSSAIEKIPLTFTVEDAYVDENGAQLYYSDEVMMNEYIREEMDREAKSDGKYYLERLLTLIERESHSPEVDSFIMSAIYEHDMTLSKIGELLGVTKQRIGQKNTRWVERLKKQSLGR